MGDEVSPSKGHPVNLTPSGRVVTNWQTVVAIIVSTVVVVGGLLTIRHDIADARREAKESADAIKEVRADVLRLRIQLGLFDFNTTTANPSTTPRNTP